MFGNNIVMFVTNRQDNNYFNVTDKRSDSLNAVHNKQINKHRKKETTTELK